MAGSASGQDESNPALWLATRAGKMELSCPLGITRCPSAWHRKFNPNNNAIFSSIFSLFWGKTFTKKFCKLSQHFPEGKEREWNRSGVVKILFQLQWMWVESVSCSSCSNFRKNWFCKTYCLKSSAKLISSLGLKSLYLNHSVVEVALSV